MSENIESIEMKPVGYVRNNIKDPSSAREMKDNESLIVMNEEYTEALEGIEEFEKLQILFFFNLSKGFNMVQKRHYDGKYAGVFATRSPRRPNGIGVTVVKSVKVEGNKLHVKGLDAVDGTPVLDIKPHIDQ